MFHPILADHEGKKVQLLCTHWKTWPPLQAFVDDTVNIKDTMKPPDYQRYQLWESNCGLRAMKADKCLTCTHVRKVERIPPHPHMMVTMDGKFKTPIHDIPTLSSLPRNRGNLTTTTRPDGSVHSKKDAAWVEREGKKPDE